MFEPQPIGDSINQLVVDERVWQGWRKRAKEDPQNTKTFMKQMFDNEVVDSCLKYNEIATDRCQRLCDAFRT